jgi:hypothetical protein
MESRVSENDDDDHQEDARHPHHACVFHWARPLALRAHDGDHGSHESRKAKPDKPAHESSPGEIMHDRCQYRFIGHVPFAGLRIFPENPHAQDSGALVESRGRVTTPGDPV